MGYARKDMTKTGRPKPENAVKGYQQNEYHNICRGFYIPPIVLQYNHQRRLNHKIQRNGGVGNERNIRKYV